MAFNIVKFCQVVFQSSELFVIYQGVKNEAEAYMLKELSLLKWQEKASMLASEDNGTQIVEFQASISGLEGNLRAERLVFFLPFFIKMNLPRCAYTERILQQ